ncbi:MAG: glycosyltransferase family 4 protein [Acidobacteriota bacterium]
MTSGDSARWVCCQLGAREHYAVARALHRRDALAALLTDAWVPPGSPWMMVPGDTGQRLSERYSADLSSATVKGFTTSLVANEASWRLRGLSGWPLILERNRWFQSQASDTLGDLSSAAAAPMTVFAHSYSALAIFKAAKDRGLTTVLGQIDPGEEHVRASRDVSQRWPEFGPPLDQPPAKYFEDWREECRLADRIIANSEWSREMLERGGADGRKIEVVALPYEATGDHPAFTRHYPLAFSTERPLRILFVGSVATFKGIPSLLASLDLLTGAPIELRVVGPMAATIPQKYLDDRRIQWIGSVSRSEVMQHMRDADVLVFPSHSDGFGMAQVEAQGWLLPIIASRSSGRVIEDGVNGFLLPEVSATAIADALRRVLDPVVAAKLSAAAKPAGLTLDEFGDALLVPERAS